MTRKASTVVGRRALLAAASVAWVYGMAAPTLAAFPGELQAGTRVEVKGRLVDRDRHTAGGGGWSGRRH